MERTEGIMMIKLLTKPIMQVFPYLLVLILAWGCKSDLRTGRNAERDAGGAEVSVTAATSGDSGSMEGRPDAGGADVGTADGSTGSPSAACGGSGWAQAGLIRDGLSANVAISQIATAMSDSGSAVVTWYEFALPLVAGDTGQLFASVCHAGSWTTPTLLASTKSARTVLAVRSDGFAMVGWAQSSIIRSDAIWAATFDPATAVWSPPLRVGAPAGLVKPSAIVMGNDGSAMIAWNESQTDWASRFNGSSWEAPVAISVGPDPLGEPGLVASPGGQTYLAMWEETRLEITPVTTSIFVRRYANGTWEAPIQLDTGDVEMAIIPPGAPSAALAIDASGNAAAAWTGGSHQLRGAIYSAASNRWTSAQTITDNGNYPILIVDPQGRAVVSYTSPVSTDAGSVSQGNLGWGEPQSALWQTTLSFGRSKIYIGADSKGRTWATWAEGYTSTNNAVLWTANYDPVNGLTSKKALWTSSGPEIIMNQSLSVSPSGRVLSAMTATSNSPSFHHKLLATTYDPNP